MNYWLLLLWALSMLYHLLNGSTTDNGSLISEHAKNFFNPMYGSSLQVPVCGERILTMNHLAGLWQAVSVGVLFWKR